MKTPDFATHYYLKDRKPFLNLSDLEKGSEDPIFLEMLAMHRTRPGYRRQFGKSYIETRKKTESKLRELFIAKGGKPKRTSPYYFILGESFWFSNFNDDHQEIRIPLKDFDPDTTSITFPDSFIAMSRADKPYFENVFLLSELPQLVNCFGIPIDDRSQDYARYWEGDFEKYIEIQLWTDELIKPYQDPF